MALSRSHRLPLDRLPPRDPTRRAGPHQVSMCDRRLLDEVRLKLPDVKRREKKDRPGFLYTKLGSAFSYGLMSGASFARTGGLAVGTDAAAASPLLSIVFLATLSLDAHYTHRDGKAQTAKWDAGSTQLLKLRAQLTALTGQTGQLTAEQIQIMQGDVATALETHPELRQQVLKISDLLLAIDAQARSLAAETPKVLIRQNDLKAWRESVDRKIARLERSGGPQTPKGRKKLAHLQSLTQMYDLMGEETLKSVYVNLARTQAKQVRDVVLYCANAAVGGPVTIANGADTLSKVSLHGALLPTEAGLGFIGVGMVFSLLSIFSNYLDAFKDAPRELRRASKAKQLVQRQMSGLAHVKQQSEAGTLSGPGDAGSATRTAISGLIHNRLRRYGELHRLTTQAWFRRGKGLMGMGLGALSFTSQGVTAGAIVAGVATMAASAGWAALALATVGIAVSAAYLGSVVQNGLFRKKRKDLMRVDEAVARLYLANATPASLRSMLAGESRGPSALDQLPLDRIDQLQLATNVRKMLLKQLAHIKSHPEDLARNPYLSTIQLTHDWLAMEYSEYRNPPSPRGALADLPTQLNIPALQVEQVRNLMRTDAPVATVYAKAQQMFASAFGLEFKIHDGADAPPTPAASTATPEKIRGMENDPEVRRILATIPPTFWEGLIAHRRPVEPPPQKVEDPVQSVTHLFQQVGSRTERRDAAAARSALIGHAWSLVWGSIREDSRSVVRGPTSAWRKPHLIQERWERSPHKTEDRNRRIRERLETRIKAYLPPDEAVSDALVDEVLRAAIRQAEHMDVGTVDGRDSSQGRSHPHRAVGELARKLLTT